MRWCGPFPRSPYLRMGPAHEDTHGKNSSEYFVAFRVGRASIGHKAAPNTLIRRNAEHTTTAHLGRVTGERCRRFSARRALIPDMLLPGKAEPLLPGVEWRDQPTFGPSDGCD